MTVHIVLVKLPVEILTHQPFRAKYYYSQSSFRTPPVLSVFEDSPVYRRRRRRERAYLILINFSSLQRFNFDRALASALGNAPRGERPV